MSEPPYTVRLYAARLPVSPVDFTDMNRASDILRTHSRCFVEQRTAVSRDLLRTEEACDDEAAHAELVALLPTAPSPIDAFMAEQLDRIIQSLPAGGGVQDAAFQPKEDETGE